MTEQKSAWYWPVRALIGLIALVVIGTVLALIFAGCAPQPDRGSPVKPDDGVVGQGSSDAGFTEQKITLSNGQKITCITWSTYDYFHEVAYGGVDCDWSKAATTP